MRGKDPEHVLQLQVELCDTHSGFIQNFDLSLVADALREERVLERSQREFGPVTNHNEVDVAAKLNTVLKEWASVGGDGFRAKGVTSWEGRAPS